MNRLPWQITADMFLSNDEVDRLLGHLRQTAPDRGDVPPSVALDRLIVEALLFSGLRTSEFCDLALGDTVVGRGHSVFVVRGRNGTWRTVHVPRRLSLLVRRFGRDVRPAFLPADVAPGDLAQPLVFNERRRPYERSGLYRRVRRVLGDAGLGDRASVQLLRHTYGYLAYQRSGGNLLFVQRQLGHAHPMVTAVYARLVRESYPSIAERIDVAGADEPPVRCASDPDPIDTEALS
jgi:integrase/recombinase XerD